MFNQQLDTFVQAASLGSFSKAAERLYVTPASIMKQINSLENQLGVKLFDRSRHGVSLTAAGQSFYTDALHIQEEIKNATARARQAAGVKQTILRVGSSLLNPCKVFMEAWMQVADSHPEFQLEIIPFSDDAKSIEAAVDKLGGELNFIIGTRRSKLWYERCSFKPLGSYTVGCAVPLKHPLARKSSLSLNDLHGEDLTIGRFGDMEVKYNIFEFLAKEHPQIRVHGYASYDIEVINTCAQTGSFLLTSGGWAGIHPAMVTLPVEWDYMTQYGILYSKHPSGKMQNFLNVLEQEGIIGM